MTQMERKESSRIMMCPLCGGEALSRKAQKTCEDNRQAHLFLAAMQQTWAGGCSAEFVDFGDDDPDEDGPLRRPAWWSDLVRRLDLAGNGRSS